MAIRDNDIVDGTAAPTTGRWRKGDIVINSAPSAGQPTFWLCTISGEPGTWTPVGSTTLDGVTINNMITTTDVGATAGGATVTAVEYGDGVVHKTVLTLAATPIVVTDALAYAGLKVYDFPAGRIHFVGVTANLAFAVTTVRADTINDNAAMDWAVGTATASNVTLGTTMVDLIPKQDKTLDGAAAAYTTAQGAALAASAVFDGTGTAKDAFLNVSFPTGTDIDADGTLNVNGTVTLTWINLGDY